MKQRQIRRTILISLAMSAVILILLARSYMRWDIMKFIPPGTAPFVEMNSCRGSLMVALKRFPEGSVAVRHFCWSSPRIPPNPPSDLIFRGGFDVIDRDSGFSLGVLGFHKGKGSEPVFFEGFTGKRILVVPGIPRSTIGVVFVSYWLILVLALLPIFVFYARKK